MKNNENKVSGNAAKVVKPCCGALRARNIFTAAFFVVVWLLLAFWESDTLFRVGEQSLFLYKWQFLEESVALPAGFLGWLGAFFIQFFYYPILGATVYVLLLYVLYCVVKKAFALPERWSLLALLPVVLVLACTTQLGYWIFYVKMQGFYYMPLVGTLLVMLAVWCCYKLRPGYRCAFILAWTFLGFPLFGAWALAGSAVMAVGALVDTIKARRGVLFGVVAFVVTATLLYSVPLWYYYKVYSTMAVEQIALAGTPINQWVTYSEKMYPNGIMEYWLPFILLVVAGLLLAVLKGSLAAEAANKRAGQCSVAVQGVLAVAIVAFTWVYWYGDANFRIENKQNRAIWDGDWEAVAAYAKDADVPTRQIVINKNMALLKLGRALDEAFTYPDGSSDIAHPGVVHLTQTGGMMNYYQYGKFNFCYRWCIENSVEYGWRNEYLKHALNCMLLSGQHKLAMRYVNILKHTLFYRGFAENAEKMIKTPSLISKQKEYTMPLLMYKYRDALELDDSYVEMYLTTSMLGTYTPDDSRLYAEAAVLHSMIKKDVNAFWPAMSRYLAKVKLQRVPMHIQEAVQLFTTLSKDITTNMPIDAAVKRRMEKFIAKTKEYKGMKETEMAPYFVEEFGDTYWYFYFFVRNIKTN